MKFLVTGSSGHLGEALMRSLRDDPRYRAHGLDVTPSAWTDQVGSIVDRDCVEAAMRGVDVVLHTATLHKPHVATHSRQAFVDTNVTGTLNLLEAATAHGVRAFVFTSTTSAFGEALVPAENQPAAWIDEQTIPQSKNIYGATKLAAEDLCRLASRNQNLPCVILRTARFFPEPDDDPELRDGYTDGNIKLNEMLYRRADVQDLVDAHLLAAKRAPALHFARYVLSATTPFCRDDTADLRRDAPAVLARRVRGSQEIYDRLGWRMFPRIERVYDNTLARQQLGWNPHYNFAHALDCLARGEDPRSALARSVGIKGYHGDTYRDGLYPVENTLIRS